MAIVSLTSKAREQFDALPGAIQPRVQKLLVRLTHWPAVSGAKPLSGNLAGQYRLRTGDYRLQVLGDAGGRRLARGGTQDRPPRWLLRLREGYRA